MSVAKMLTEESIQGKARMAGGAKGNPFQLNTGAMTIL